ncbi:hypothetical protein OUZ56_032425 [Daphnia magna]|uniref:Uncharacterized protein n=1 Tax=Daphnia magna TaxID=35525 RepID=A0ABR0B8X4_9CRUS|nr:hypothetical protein OUZ56_032425 [Daphnia magna]
MGHAGERCEKLAGKGGARFVGNAGERNVQERLRLVPKYLFQSRKPMAKRHPPPGRVSDELARPVDVFKPAASRPSDHDRVLGAVAVHGGVRMPDIRSRQTRKGAPKHPLSWRLTKRSLGVRCGGRRRAVARVRVGRRRRTPINLDLARRAIPRARDDFPVFVEEFRLHRIGAILEVIQVERSHPVRLLGGERGRDARTGNGH